MVSTGMPSSIRPLLEPVPSCPLFTLTPVVSTWL
jgi:hypothetical protein